MKDITSSLLEYREAKRHLWNTYFLPRFTSLRECGPLDDFEEIDRHLFQGLVLAPLGPTLQAGRPDNSPILAMRVIPTAGASALPLILSEATEGMNRVWATQSTVSMEFPETHLAYIGLFDWDVYGNVSFPYYQAKVITAPGDVNSVGRECLVEVSLARVVVI